MSKDVNGKAQVENTSEEQFSLNDDRRVKVLSPGRMVAKRFFRSRISVLGLCILIFMFLFSFVGGLISPYAEDEIFYRMEGQNKTYAGVVKNNEYRYAVAEGQTFDSVLQARSLLLIQQGGSSFSQNDINYNVVKEGEDLYSVSLDDGTILGIAYKDIVSSSNEGESCSFSLQFAALKAYTNGQNSFEVDGASYSLDAEGGIFEGTTEVGYISRFVVNPKMPDIFISRDFKELIEDTIENDEERMTYTNADGVSQDYLITFMADSNTWEVLENKETLVFDQYAPPSAEHWLGTDGNGMDMLTRLMYGGRVSLIIGFIVEIIANVLGVIMGGISGYFGKAVDMIIMRIVDIFYCIPSTPILIIIGAAMDAARVPATTRMIYLMLILGFLSWPGVARMIRGMILSLREQEFMTATEACGIKISRRISRHLVPNVMPQIIVSATMGLGSTIITEATLSFLGLGVKFPFASWGNIITDVNNIRVLTEYWYVWIPAGVCLLMTVLAFNLVGDGLRDAFDPKMKR